MAKFNIKKAKEAGYTDEQITDFLSKETPSFNISKAKEAGYSNEQINQFLSSEAKKESTPHGPRDTAAIESLFKPKTEEEQKKSFTEKVKSYFSEDKFGQALALQRKSGGFAGAPALYPEEAKEVATEVATIAAVEAAFAPVIGAAEASRAPRILSSLARLSQAGTTGASVAATKKLVDEGELPSPEELVKDGATWVAIDAAMQAAHITAAGGKKVYDFGKAVNDISKKDNIPVTEVLKNLWEASKNYIGQKFGRVIQSPSEILPADVEVLADKVKQIEGQRFGNVPKEESIEPSAPETPSEGTITLPEPQYAPEEQKLTAPREFLMSDYEIAQDIQKALSPLRQEANKKETVPPVTINRIFSPVKEELNALSPHRLNDPDLIGRETARAVKRVSGQLYKATSELWNIAEDMASQEILPRPELVNNLRAIAEEAPSRAAGGEAKLQNFAQSLIDKLERRKGRRVHYQAMSNEQLIKEIKQARVGYDYGKIGGVQGHRVNEFINAVEQELIRTSSDESRNALLRARDAYRTWAFWFKDPKVLPFRSEKLGRSQSLYRNITSPDTYNILKDILSQDRRGQHLLQLTARNMLEKALEPHLMKPKSFNPMKFERDMASLKGIVPEELIRSLGQKLYQLHNAAINEPAPTAQRGASFAHISEREIPSKLRTLEGLLQLKKELSQVPGGKEKYREIAGTMGIDLIFGGQMDVPANSDRIRRMIHDRNGRPYIKETLGEDNLKVLDDLVAKNKLEKRLLEIKESPTLSSMVKDPDILITGGKLLWHILRGNPISIITNAAKLQKKFSKKVKNAEATSITNKDVSIQ
jgi:hypothetical protein